MEIAPMFGVGFLNCELDKSVIEYQTRLKVVIVQAKGE